MQKEMEKERSLSKGKGITFLFSDDFFLMARVK